MLDAFGKPESGIFEGNLKWLGSYDECVTTVAAVNKSGTIIYPWMGQYCTTQFSLDKLAKVFIFSVHVLLVLSFHRLHEVNTKTDSSFKFI